MTDTYDLIVRNGTIATPSGIAKGDIGIRDGKFAAIGQVDGDAGQEINATGLHVLPGVIDTQVHFREPGLEYKEDLETGSRAAVLGGVTAVFEMPNTNPPTTDEAALADKVARGRNRMFCDFAFFMGASAENARHIAELERVEGCSGIKIFMGSSTGSLLVDDDDNLREVLRHGSRRISIHAEDEPRLLERQHLTGSGDVHDHPNWRDVEVAVKATKRIIALARETGRRIHVLHVTTADEVPILAANKDIVSCEVTPQHLTLAAPDCYDRIGTRAQMNPPIRTAEHRAGLWAGVQGGVFDVYGSDHAPHTLEEKGRDYPATPAGMPGVQTSVPVLLNHVAEGRLTLERFIDLTSAGPQRIFNIAGKGRVALGYDADLTIVDLKAQRTITDDWSASKSGWTPFDGMSVTGWPMGTIIRGQRVMWEDQILGAAHGQPVRFNETF